MQSSPPRERTEQWTPAESQLLVSLVEEHGTKWVELATHFDGRTGTQLRNRHLRIEKGREKTAMSKSRNKCRTCGEKRAGHICTGVARTATTTDDVALLQDPAGSPSVPGGSTKPARGVKRPSRRKEAEKLPRAPYRASWMSNTTGTTNDSTNMQKFVQGGLPSIDP